VKWRRSSKTIKIKGYQGWKQKHVKVQSLIQYMACIKRISTVISNYGYSTSVAGSVQPIQCKRMKDNFLECILEHNWFDMRLYETRWDKMERDNVIYGYDTTLHSVIDKRRDKPGTPKQNPIHQHSAWKQEQAPLFAMGHLSHGVSSVLSYPLTLVVVRVRGKYLLLPMTTLHV